MLRRGRARRADGSAPEALEAGPRGSGLRAARSTPARTSGRRPRSLTGEGPAQGYRSAIALRAIDGNLARTASSVTAWYRLAPQPWSFRSDSQRETLIRQIATQLGELQGRWLHVRVTSRPYPVALWAEAFDHNAPGRMPDVPGALSWEQFLEGEQRHLMGLSMSDKEVFLGVEVSGRSIVDRWLEGAAPILGRLVPSAATAELAALESEIAHVEALVSRAGLDAVPATAEDMAWLMHRSCSLGLPAPRTVAPASGEHWETEDLAAFTDGVALQQEPYAPTVQVLGRFGTQPVQRHVAVLSVGLMDALRIPEADDPWMQRSDRLPFPVEWSARIYVRKPEEVAGELQRQMGKVRSQIRHYTHDHDLDPPMSLARQADRVLQIEDELSGGLTQLNTRVYGWWRVAVSGRDEGEALTRAQQVLDLYRPRVAMEHPEAQYAYAREFIPGEPLASTAYRRRGSVTWVAAGVPAASASVGDRRGIMLGETCTATRRPVAWDPWMAQEVRRASGLTAIVGGLGSGKSFLTGLLVYKTLRAGARWTVLDPSGPLAELTKLPELAPFSRHIHLLGADPGILNPYRVVAEPRREHFLDEEDPDKAWRRERSLAAATRRRLVLDVLTGLLPFDVARMPHTRIVLLRAVREVGGAPDRDPGQVIAVLRRHAREGEEHADVVADFLEERRELPQAALLFPDGSTDPRADPWVGEENYRLTVLTMQGMALPRPGSPREEWTDGESLAVELLNLASWLTQRTIYTADRNLRKGVALDETHFLSQIPTGKVLIDRLARDSRKFNVRALFASQLAGDLLRVPGFASLVNAVFVGRTDDEEAQAEALRLLRVPTEVGYEEMLGTLSPRPSFQRHGHDDRPDDTPRQFVFADGHGGVEKIRIDLEGAHLEHLRVALDTNPDARRVRPMPAPGASAPRDVPVPPETDAERTGPVPVVPAAGPPPAGPPPATPPTPPPGTARVTPVTPSRDPMVERTVVEGMVLDERPDDADPALPPGLDDLVPDLDDDLAGRSVDGSADGSADGAGPAGRESAGDDEWAEAWVMDEGTGEDGASGDAVGELADDATVTAPGDRGPGARRDAGEWVGAGRHGPGTPA
ncbi:ATP-binding protein [Actinomycetospora cinnamomea]|uniref:AAA domain-containing protein n=1 Tax=Actinomycetospora cinnamomea TaxID=663609 RepID=A0A2U1FG58_9PSEU|nr:ATP-binding protein [Actinomycetospora cinnamomea]PVZ11137.1 AAA domain-containing protein [Actinomycetospora cinnamomea]